MRCCSTDQRLVIVRKPELTCAGVVIPFLTFSHNQIYVAHLDAGIAPYGKTAPEILDEGALPLLLDLIVYHLDNNMAVTAVLAAIGSLALRGMASKLLVPSCADCARWNIAKVAR